MLKTKANLVAKENLPILKKSPESKVAKSDEDDDKVLVSVVEVLTDAINKLIQADSKKIYYDKELGKNLSKSLLTVADVLKNLGENDSDDSALLAIIEQNSKVIKELAAQIKVKDNGVTNELLTVIRNNTKAIEQNKDTTLKKSYKFDIIRSGADRLIDHVNIKEI